MTYQTMKELDPETTEVGFSQRWKDKYWVIVYIDPTGRLDGWYFLAKYRSSFIVSDSPYSDNTVVFDRRWKAEKFAKEEGLSSHYYLINLGDLSRRVDYYFHHKDSLLSGKFKGSQEALVAMARGVR